MSLLGIAFEGGGARGSYQAGAAKALVENGYVFNGCVGSSIGSINGALMAQNNLDVMLDLWSTTEVSSLFDMDDDVAKYIVNMQFDKLDMTKIYNALTKVIKDRGADTSKIRKLLNEIIDEEKIRSSGNDYGLVTVGLPDFRPYEVMIDEIPSGKLIDYIMASTCFPGFKSAQIGAKQFIDGGFYDNMPVNLLAKRGYKNIFAIRTDAPGMLRKLEFEDVEVTTIKPSENLGLLMYFSSEQAKKNITLGYYDTLKTVKNLSGVRYYVEAPSDQTSFELLSKLDDVVISGIAMPLGIKEKAGKRLLFEKVIPTLSLKLKIPKNAGYSDFIVGLFEFAADEWEVERFNTYSFIEFVVSVRAKIDSHHKSKREMTPIITSVLRLIAALPIERK